MRLFDRLEKRRTTGILRNPRVQLQVHGLVQHAIGLRPEHINATSELFQLEALTRRGEGGKPQGGLHFERFPHDVVPLHILGGRNSDPRPGTRPAFEEPFHLESQQGFRYRKETHAKLGGKLPARDHLSQTNCARQDPLADDGIRFRGQTGLLCSVTHVQFSESAIEAVFKASRGTPRVINLICDRALQRGHLARVTIIEPALIHEAVALLGIETPAAPVAPLGIEMPAAKTPAAPTPLARVEMPAEKRPTAAPPTDATVVKAKQAAVPVALNPVPPPVLPEFAAEADLGEPMSDGHSRRIAIVLVIAGMGSGSVGVAALKLGRRFIGTDLNPEAVRWSAERLRKFGNGNQPDDVAATGETDLFALMGGRR